LGRLLERIVAERESAREGTIRIIRESSDQLGRYRGAQRLGNIMFYVYSPICGIICSIKKTCQYFFAQPKESKRLDEIVVH